MKLHTLFLIFFRLGFFTLGGGYAMLPLIEHEMCKKRNLIADETFFTMIVYIQAIPGPVALNAATYIGFHVRRFWGAFACLLGVVCPSFLVMLLIAHYISFFLETPWIAHALQGVLPVFSGLLFATMIRLWQKSNRPRHTFCIPVAIAFAIVVFNINPFFLISVSVLFVLLRQWWSSL